MRWFRKKQDFDLSDLEAGDLNPKRNKDGTVFLPAAQLKRWLLYDAQFPDADEVGLAMGLSSVSEDGEAIERQSSDHRLVKIRAFLPLASTYSSYVAEACLRQQFSHTEYTVDSPEGEAMIKAYSQVSYAALIGFLAAMHDVEVLHSNLLAMR